MAAIPSKPVIWEMSPVWQKVKSKMVAAAEIMSPREAALSPEAPP